MQIKKLPTLPTLIRCILFGESAAVSHDADPFCILMPERNLNVCTDRDLTTVADAAVRKSITVPRHDRRRSAG